MKIFPFAKTYEKMGDKSKAKDHTLIVNYSGIETAKMQEAIHRLFQSLWESIEI